MRNFTFRGHWSDATRMFCVCVLYLCLTPVQVLAEDTQACMTRLLAEASDNTTVGELRKRCKEQQVETVAEPPKETSPIDVRLEQDRENVLQPFTLMAHKPNYILPGAYNAEGYDASLFKQQFSDPTISFKDTEAQFQVSLKIPLWVNLADTFDIYAAYTNRSFWQVYNGDFSSPFRETNHEPEAWAQFTPGWEFLGLTNSANAIGISHQSNGRGGVLSRSWNRIYANFVFHRGNFAFGIKPWLRIPEDREDDDNPDITDYLGHFEWRAGYKWNKHVFSFMSRNNLESGFDRGAVELGWSFQLHSYPYLKGYVQYFR
ncbi:MAG: phospholipase A, partial [Lysobacterales bacterium]